MAIGVGVQSTQLRPWMQAGPESWLAARCLVTRSMVALAVGVAAALRRAGACAATCWQPPGSASSPLASHCAARARSFALDWQPDGLKRLLVD
jgi:hypothetical protein